MSILGPLLLLGSVLATVALLVTAFVALARGHRFAALRFLLAIPALAAAYALLLVAFSLGSKQQVLARESTKRFCAADCDLAFAVESAQRQADRIVVQVRVQSSAARVTMRPSAPEATLIDDTGREFTASDELDPEPFARLVAPGASYVKTLVYHVPSGVREPKLYLSEGGWVTRFLIGDENSFLHQRTLIRLTPL